eukprot:TRINITY_DN1378_c0_g2_i2.p1 TRINITY_DN1378_c0_g2~~TRINITY_DN1378_c0_g2_i2.p1  ORF type:complete len:274 (+),score=82.18 TRINITY_DN1378_c0_g2_i2:577-1398(+)
MGSGVTVDQTLSNQAFVQLPLLQQFYNQVPAPQRPNLAASIQSTNCTITTAIQQFNLLRSGAINPTGATSLVCPTGAVNPVTLEVFCAADCVCLTTPMTGPCAAQCAGAAAYGGGQLALFYNSWLQMSQYNTRLQAMNALRGRLLTVNSWTDLLIPPMSFAPLQQAVLTQLSNTQQYLHGGGPIAEVSSQVFGNLTHLMTPYLSAAVPHVSPAVLQALDNFLLQTGRVPYAPLTTVFAILFGVAAALLVIVSICALRMCCVSKRRDAGELMTS